MTEIVTALPPAAIVVADKAYRAIASDPLRVHLLDAPDSLVVPYSAEPVARAESVLAVRDKLIARDMLNVDQLLVRNPYDVSAYTPADDAVETFVKAKYYHLASIAGLLGATSVKFVKVEIEQEKSDFLTKVKSDMKAVTGAADVGQSVKKNLEGRFDASTEYVGKEADVAGAREFMIARRLMNDPDVVGLIDLCATGNPLRKHRVKINGLRESTNTLKAGFDLAVALQVPMTTGGNFTRAVESISSIEVTTEITW